jgi:DNA-binding FadR family transcriptional regulator
VRIDPHSDRAVYKQLADIFREQILSGTVPPGGNLLSENQAAREYQIGREAVRQAVAILRAEGLVETSRGGTRVRAALRRTQIRLHPGDRATSRMPIEPERSKHDIGEGIPVIEIHRPDGTTELHPADGVELVQG